MQVTATMEMYGVCDATSFQIATISVARESPLTKHTGWSRPAIFANRTHTWCFAGSSLPSISL